MAREVSIYGNRQVSFDSLQPVQASNAGAVAWEAFSDFATKTAQNIDLTIEENERKALERYSLEKQVQLRTAITENSLKHQANPAALKEALSGYRDGFLDDVTDEDLRARLSFAFDTETLSAVEKATLQQQRRIEDELRASQLRAYDATLQSAQQYAGELFSADPVQREQAITALARQMAVISGLTQQTGPSGQALATPQEMATLEPEFMRQMALTGLTSRIKNEADPIAFVDGVLAGGFKADIPGLGMADPMAVFTDREQVAEQLKAVAQQTMAERREQAAMQVADLEIAINSAEATNDIAKLQQMQQQVDRMAGVLTPSKRVQLTNAVNNAVAKAGQEAAAISSGMAIIQGEQSLNPQNREQVAAVDKSIEAMIGAMQGLGAAPEQIDAALVNFTNNARTMLPSVIGTVQQLTRSGKPEDAVRAAEIINKLDPLVQMQMPEHDRAIVEKTAEYIRAGYDKREADKLVKNEINPANKALIDSRNAAIKELNYDYSKQVSGLFDGGWLATAPKIPESLEAELESTYRTAFEGHYRLTGDEALSKKQAEIMLTTRYGESAINGNRQVMIFPPEQYYAVPGYSEKQNSEWIRQQALEDASQLYGEAVPPFDELNILIIPNANTARLAAQGQPAYDIFYRTANGVLQQLNPAGKMWAPDANRARQNAVKEGLR